MALMNQLRLAVQQAPASVTVRQTESHVIPEYLLLHTCSQGYSVRFQFHQSWMLTDHVSLIMTVTCGQIRIGQFTLQELSGPGSTVVHNPSTVGKDGGHPLV